MASPRNLTARCAHWSAAHRRAAIFGWLAFVLISFAVGTATGMVPLKAVEAENGQSRLADLIQAEQFPVERAGEQVIVVNPHGKLVGTPYTAAVAELAQRLSHTRYVASVRSPLAPGSIGQFSKDGRAALITFQITGDPDTAQDRVASALAVTAAVQHRYPQLFVGQLGVASTAKAVNQLIAKDFQGAELTSLPVMLVILVLAFGAVVAALVPLLLGFTAVLAALGLTALLSHALHVEQSIDSVILLIGLAVGIDYSLFYIRREREERARGRQPGEALQSAAATSGQAILISGLTVMIAMTGMFLMGNQVFTSFGMGTVLVVAIALVGSLTVLPAILAVLGDRIDRGRVPFLNRLRARPGESRFWSPIIGGVLRRPLLWGGLTAAALVAVAIPAFSLHTVSPGMQGLPTDLPVMKAYAQVQRQFPGGAIPETVVIKARDVTAAPVQQGIAQLKRAALATHQMFEPIMVDISGSHQAARVVIPMAGTGMNDVSLRALAQLRDHVIPATLGRVPGVRAYTTGGAGQTVDFNNTMKSHSVLVFAFVLGMAFILLLVMFRSIVIPATTILLNLLSVGASYGLLVLIFQKGELHWLFGFSSIGGIVNWIPLFLFVILFGLSMDYHVFILSRVREAHEKGMSTEDAVAHGIKASAGVVTSAAIVMVAVFAIFVTLNEIVFQMLGFGLAVAILLDATLVRAVLLPATMKLLGDRNWYLPGFLQWLPGARRGVGLGDANHEIEQRRDRHGIGRVVHR